MRCAPRTTLAALLVALACALPASSLAAGAGGDASPIHPTAQQAVALNQLTAYVTSLVGLTRTITQGIDVQTPTIVALRSRFIRWNRTRGAQLPQKLAPALVLGRRAVAVLDAMQLLETRGGAANTTRVRIAVASFNSAVVTFSKLPFA